MCIRLYRATENTNQRVFFDIEPCGRHLGTGGQVLFDLPFPKLEKIQSYLFPLYQHTYG